MIEIFIVTLLVCVFVGGTANMIFDQIDKGKFDNIFGTGIMVIISVYLILTLICLFL